MAQEVTVKIFASLFRWTRKPEVQVSLEGPISLRALLERLGIPEEEVAVIIRNGKQVKIDSEVEPGDTISLFPVIDGG
ncbi:MAG: MoaD/ThiS family protein [Spirochaetes bacterium]|nr:MoaD/ThiS family protein [Spirochaetota bacterium]